MNFKYAIFAFICFGLGGLMPEHLNFLFFYAFFAIYFFYEDLKKLIMGD